MRGLEGRGLRLSVVAGLLSGLGLAYAAPAPAADGAQKTQTTLATATRFEHGHTVVSLSVGVTGEDGRPASGAVVLTEDGKQLAGAALSGEGHAQMEVTLPAGEHSLTASYLGDAAHAASVSAASGVKAEAASTTPDFGITVSPAAMTLTAGQSGTAAVAVAPVNASALTAPMFVTLSCSGFPDQASCTFTPENVEILPGSTTAIPSSMVISTQGTSLAKAMPAGRGNPVAWAVLLPGTLGLAGLAFATRRRRWVSRLSVLALLGLVTTLGATACAARYNYYNHGPPYNRPTPTGTYTLQVTAQSSNGVTATTHSTTFALTVQ